ncbi:MAG: ABC transporter permease [Marvinbryantia sp.]|jgi:ribose transport system permease protein|uniref:ABC transporter permease n=1 Tax=Marvinbryantia sp. TaxID=2496532 RepID=UPI0025E68266|nr:ABC transporter permease [uncultured Marvinbryantia sp.]
MKAKKIDLSRYGIVFAWIVLVLIFAICEPSFLKTSNIFNILRQVSIVGVCSVGMTFVILTGGMDLSVGSVIGVSAVAGAQLLSRGWPIPIVIILILLLGAAAGLFNAFFINEIGIAPIIMTLGTMTALRGVAFLLCGGFPVYGIDKRFLVIGQGYVGVVPVPVIIMAGAFAVGYILLNKFPFGRFVYGIGSNQEAARLSGTNVKLVLYKVYTLAGALYALAGMMLMARVNSGQANSGEGYEMDVITGCVLGGISISGGEGRIMGVIVGVLLMGTLSNGMVLMNVSEYWQKVVKGLVLILAVTLDKVVQKQKSK